MNFTLKDPANRPATVPHVSPHFAYNDDHGALIDSCGVARIQSATAGIKSIVTLLQQREIDLECLDDGGDLLKLAPVTVSGLLHALTCCAEFVEQVAIGKAAHSRELDSDQHRAAHQAIQPKRPTKGNTPNKN